MPVTNQIPVRPRPRVENARRGLLQHCAIVLLADDPAQCLEIFHRAEHHDVREKLYRVGKRPLRLSGELPGFVGNRLQEAMWREALHMVAAGEATVEEIDASIAWGPGLRWAQMGPCLTFHLAGGSGGIAHMLDHFGAALLEPWTRLEAPALTPQLRERLVDGCLRQAAGRADPIVDARAG